MDVTWRQIGSFVGGTISNSAIPLLGSLFTQPQIDAADVAVVYVSAAVNWSAAAGTVAVVGNNGIPLEADKVSTFRGKEVIQNLSFIRKSSDAIMTIYLFGGR
jgi:hypothetical protein